MNLHRTEFCFSKITAHESGFKTLFELIPDPPSELWIQGSEKALRLLDLLPDRGLGLVGTRAPRERTLSQISAAIHGLRGQNLVVISGFARGVDAQAHVTAIQAGLPTIAIVAAGLAVPYPSQHGELRRKILEAGGLIVSEVEPQTEPRPHSFLRRNRIIAAWSQAVWVAEASHRSGALNTAAWARDLHRTCLATPCAPGDPDFAGNQGLLDHHHALAFWGPHSLGAAWLELAGLGLSRPLNFSSPGLKRAMVKGMRKTSMGDVDDTMLLVSRLRQSTYARGGESISALLDWAVSQGFEPSAFFSVLDDALQRNLCQEERGILLAFK